MNVTPTSSSSSSSSRALVLGGGGSTGNAWLIGVLAGLADAGLDVTDAGTVIGTSAGSTAAAQIASTPLPELYAAALVAPPARATVGVARAGTRPVVDHLARLTATIEASTDVADFRRRMGSAALELDAASDDPWSERWRDTVAARLPGAVWPAHRLLITAIDARTGDPVVLDRASGVDLVDAVAASCSSGRPYRVDDARYLDGGYRANAENADLAAGHERVLVLSPFGGRSLMPASWGTHLTTQIEGLRAGGSRVETVVPDAKSEHLFGPSGMDLALRPAAARAGFEEGARATDLSAFWR